MEMKPYEGGSSERYARTDPELLARVQAIETLLPSLATRAQLEQLRGEMKEGLGAVRTELHQGFGEVRAEMHRTVTNVMKWTIGIAISCVGLSAAVITAVMPLVASQMRG